MSMSKPAPVARYTSPYKQVKTKRPNTATKTKNAASTIGLYAPVM